jgi:hypothetical protein
MEGKESFTHANGPGERHKENINAIPNIFLVDPLYVYKV